MDREEVFKQIMPGINILKPESFMRAKSRENARLSPIT
jgi:hypothetical protein